MSTISESTSKLINTDTNFTDNNIDLIPYIFWRYEYNVDTQPTKHTFNNYTDNQNTWSNYKDNGKLYIYNNHK
jgi:hypothetical protein